MITMKFLSGIKAWFRAKTALPLNTKLAFSKEDFITTKFHHGVEVRNDDKTTMEFVIISLMKHFGLKRNDAIVAMLICHEYDNVVMPVATISQAEQIAQTIMDEARERGYPLVCGAISNPVITNQT